MARGDGGAVTWMTVLKARRNCLADRFSGNTYINVKFQDFQALCKGTYCKEILDIEGEMLGGQFRVVGDGEDNEHQAVRCFEDLKQQAVGASCEVRESSCQKQLFAGLGGQDQREMLCRVQKEQVQAPFDWMVRNLTNVTGLDAAEEVLRKIGILREDIDGRQEHEILLRRSGLASSRRDEV